MLPVAAAAGAVVTPPPRTGDVPATKRRAVRPEAEADLSQARQGGPAGQAVEAAEAEAPGSQGGGCIGRARARAAGGVPLAPAPKRQRTWKLRHWVVILAAPLLLIAGGAFAYAKLTEPAPTAQVPDIVDRDILAAIGIMKDAGFSVRATPVDNPRPGGTVLTQHPGNGEMLEEGSAVEVTVSKTDALVPEVSTMDVEDAKVELRERGLSVFTVTPDYRDDVDPGTVMSTNPAANYRSRKLDPIELVVATDPHVKVPSVVGVEQADATARAAGARPRRERADPEQQLAAGRHRDQDQPGHRRNRRARRHHHAHGVVGPQAGDRPCRGAHGCRRRHLRPPGPGLRGERRSPPR